MLVMSYSENNTLIERLTEIYKKMTYAAMRAGSNPESIKLIAVTKTIKEETVIDAFNAGARIFGENRVQEAKSKIEEISKLNESQNMSWHLIGHLQKNKAKIAIHLFDLIHSVDSYNLTEELNKHAAAIGKVQKILVQVKLSDEENKYGVLDDDLVELLEKINRLDNIKVDGLMTMTPFFKDREMTRPYYARLKHLKDLLEQSGYKLQELSMGMSNDYEIAIEEGATMVRIGTALFGERS